MESLKNNPPQPYEVLTAIKNSGIFLYRFEDYAKANEGDALAQFVAGQVNGYDGSLETAAKHYQKAADQNFAPANLFLGIFYREGWSVKKDYSKAMEYFQKAAESRETIAEAKHCIAYSYLNGHGVEKDVHKAIDIFEDLAKNGNIESQIGWAEICLDKRNESNSKDLIKSLRFFCKASLKASKDIHKERLREVAKKELISQIPEIVTLIIEESQKPSLEEVYVTALPIDSEIKEPNLQSSTISGSQQNNIADISKIGRDKEIEARKLINYDFIAN